MDEFWRRHLGQDEVAADQPVGTRLTAGARMVLLIGTGVAVSLACALSDPLATTGRVWVMTGFVGLVAMAWVMAIRWILRGGDHGGGPGRGRLQPIPLRPMADPDAELRRILDDGRLHDRSLNRPAHVRNHRPEEV